MARTVSTQPQAALHAHPYVPHETEQLLLLQRDLTLALGCTSDINEAFSEVLSAVINIDGIDCGGGYLIDSVSGALNLVAHAGLSDAFIAQTNSYPPDALQTNIVMAGQPVYKSYHDLLYPQPVQNNEGLHATAVLPVAHNGQVIAALNLASHTHDVIDPHTRYLVEMIAAQIGGVIARIKAETARQESLQNLQTLFDTVSDFLFVLDAQGHIVRTNPAVQRRLGYSQEELSRMHVLDVHPPERRAEAGQIVAAMLEGKLSLCPVPILSKDGEYVPVETKVVKGQWSGQPGLFGLSRDISERLQAEAALRERELLLEALFTQAIDGVFFMLLDTPVRWDATVDKEATLDYVFAHQRVTRSNAAMLEQYRASEAEYIGKTPADFFAHDIAHGRAIWRKFFDAGRLHIETDERRFDGSQMWVEGDYVCLYDTSGRITGHFGIQRDVTQRIQAEAALQESYAQLESTLHELHSAQEKLLQQERLAAVGQLAAGIAHDFNNILACILSYSELLQMTPEATTPMRADLQTIINSSQRAAVLVRQLLDFSRKTIRHPRRLHLDAFTRDMIVFLERVIPEHIQIALSVTPGSYLIEADPTQIQQIITNLALNARDAMPGGGRLRLALTRAECDGSLTCAICSHAIEGTWVQLAVSDNGNGIPGDILPHIFEPFFTTKDVGQGTGLGLSQVYGIVTQHNGHITVESWHGLGTTFTIYLPPAGVSAKPVTGPLGHIKPGQGECILLVEDEPTVLAVTTAMLKQLGYEVLTAANGIEALAQFKVHRSKLGLVISDMVMPDMDGAQLFYHLRAQSPQLKMIIISGYPLGNQGAQLLDQGIVAWVEKPITFRQLSQVVSNALATAQGRWG